MTTRPRLLQRLKLKLDSVITILEETITFARSLAWLCIDLLLVMGLLALVLRRIAPDTLWLYTYAVVLSIVFACITVFRQLYITDYLQTAISYGLRRVAIGKAGLAFIESTKKTVLLNRQREDPWRDMWCLPGGYFNIADRFVTGLRQRHQNCHNERLGGISSTDSGSGVPPHN